jgi:hypothetical protein
MMSDFKPGQECSHAGCRSHVTHPCEGCGRYAAGLGSVSVPEVERARVVAQRLIGVLAGFHGQLRETTEQEEEDLVVLALITFAHQERKYLADIARKRSFEITPPYGSKEFNGPVKIRLTEALEYAAEELTRLACRIEAGK